MFFTYFISVYDNAYKACKQQQAVRSYFTYIPVFTSNSNKLVIRSSCCYKTPYI
jgi:hypothetical protein